MVKKIVEYARVRSLCIKSTMIMKLNHQSRFWVDEAIDLKLFGKSIAIMLSKINTRSKLRKVK